jgi:hypothetical protein
LHQTEAVIFCRVIWFSFILRLGNLVLFERVVGNPDYATIFIVVKLTTQIKDQSESAHVCFQAVTNAIFCHKLFKANQVI